MKGAEVGRAVLGGTAPAYLYGMERSDRQRWDFDRPLNDDKRRRRRGGNVQTRCAYAIPVEREVRDPDDVGRGDLSG